ncbi:hypothetical protein ES705_24881 [subsurface metagenome]
MNNQIKHSLTPEELIRELEARAYGESALVIITVSQWKTITEAYHSPLIEKIANTALQVFPQRSLPEKKLSFMTFAREFKR